MPSAGSLTRLLLAVVAAPLAAAAPLPAAAQAVTADDPVLLGAAVRQRPEWDGSAMRRTDVVPVLRYYGPRWFARTTQGVLEGGVRERLGDFHAGAQLAYEPAHRDLGAGASVGLHLEWDQRIGPAPVTFLLRARQNLDRSRGGEADLRITAGVLQRGGLLAGVFGQATWGTANALASRYGAQRSGLMFASAGVLGSYDLARHWVLVASAERRSLYDQAADSPITERVRNGYVSAGIAYRFGR